VIGMTIAPEPPVESTLDVLEDEAPDPWAFLIGVAVGAGVAALLLLAT
jgi:hypothetical protein